MHKFIISPFQTLRLAVAAFTTLSLTLAAVPEPLPLVEIDHRVDSLHIVAEGSTRVGSTHHCEEPVLRMEPGGEEDDAKVSFMAPRGAWDLAAFESVEIVLTNAGTEPVVVWGQAANPGGEANRDQTRNAISISPGATDTLRVRLVRRPEDPGWETFSPFIMYFREINVRDNTVDPASIERLALWLEQARPGQSVLIHSIVATGEGVPAPVPFFPFVDAYGQYIHSQWPGKVYSDDDFAGLIEKEQAEMRDWSGPPDWNEFGGWAAGPELEATGFFRTEKYEGKWSFVDPSGRLFWSYGPTGVGFGGGVTPFTEREHWFRDLPSADSRYASNFAEQEGARGRFYQNRSWRGFSFADANLRRKYGEDYRSVIVDVSHARMRSWGFNTLAAWSSYEVAQHQRTPYTAMIHPRGPMIHYSLPDVFHEDWARAVRDALEAERHTTAKDPWNIGFFVDNELAWLFRPRAAHVGQVAIQRNRKTASKREFVRMLREKYGSIEAFNSAWEHSHASWEALLDSNQAPDMDNAAILEDCGDFGMAYAERYFSFIREVLDDVAPNHLYMGPRFHGHIDKELFALAARYLDVVSYNVYDNPPSSRVERYRDIDVPIVVGEFSAGNNLVQTPFRYEGRPSPDPEHRVRLLDRYLRSAFADTHIIGAHFFQFRDQPLSGRPDGEAGMRGFINATDTPHFDMVQSNRRLAYELYRMRFGQTQGVE
ncbi:MAG: hypothetical protein EA353_12135 [Puniceicoccaceae bacterium]|nr:MAG: hypothetical protein EA353_12135 [Puniceicoccaceae bacterium]